MKALLKKTVSILATCTLLAQIGIPAAEAATIRTIVICVPTIGCFTLEVGHVQAPSGISTSPSAPR